MKAAELLETSRWLRALSREVKAKGRNAQNVLVLKRAVRAKRAAAR